MSFLQLDEAFLRRAGALSTAREIAQQPANWTRTHDLTRELRADAIAARVIAITAQSRDRASLGDHLYVQHADWASDGELLFPFSICGQLYAFHRALSLGNKPDQPSKSGSVNRVVRGVTVHAL